MDEQGHEAEVRNPTAEDEQPAVTTEKTENSTGGANTEDAKQKEEDELIVKAQNLMDNITTGANNPNPTILHALSHLLESQESLFIKENGFYSNGRSNHISGKLCNLIRENDEFFEMVSSNLLTENTYSTAIKAASVRLLMNCSLTSMYPYVFDDAVMENFKNWVLDEAVKFPGEHSSSSKEASDAEMLKTYSTGLLAVSLTSRGQLLEDVLSSGLSAKLMHYLRVRVIGESSTSRRDAHATEAKHVSLKAKEEGRGRVRRVVDTVEGDHVLEADSGREVGQSEGEFDIVSAVVDGKLKPGDDNTGRDDPLRQRLNRSKTRGRGKVNEGATDTDVLLTSPRSSRLGVRDRDLSKNSDVRNAEDVTTCLGRMKSGVMGIERDENDECFQGCLIGTKNITDLVKKAIGAAETEARAAHAPDDAAKAAGDAAAELVKTAALEEFKSSCKTEVCG